MKERLDIDALAHMISGALDEAVFLVPESSDRASTHRRVVATMRRWIMALEG